MDAPLTQSQTDLTLTAYSERAQKSQRFVGTGQQALGFYPVFADS
jgi:hypothetical protein